MNRQFTRPVKLFAIFLFLVIAASSAAAQNPEADYNATQLLAYWGYPAELYEVQTSDGYILTIHRIPHGRNETGVPYSQGANNNNNNKAIVYLQHGLLAAADSFFWNPPPNSLATQLADAGFDVWLGNFRGNVYSQKHAWLNPKSREFWKFSWDEMALVDLPTMIGKALEITGQKQVIYIGHSEGTTTGFAALAANQTFAVQVTLMVALAPVTYAKHVKSPIINLLAKFSKNLDILFTIFGYENFLVENVLTREIIDRFCSGEWGPVPENICENLVFIVMGFDTYEFNRSRNDVYMNHFPAGTSTQNMFHYGQMVESGNFQAFDYGGPLQNFEHYGEFRPPIYRPQNIRNPVALFTASNDWLSVEPDVNRLRRELSNVVYEYHVPFLYWNHVDYILGVDSRSFYMDKLIDFVVNFNGSKYSEQFVGNTP